MLEWAWHDVVRGVNGVDDMSIGQLSSIMREILAEILVINTTAVEDYQEKDINMDILSVVITTLSFFKLNWFILNYSSYTEVQDEFREIRAKVRATN